MTLRRVLLLVSLILFVFCSGCALADKDVEGRYSVHSQEGAQPLAVEVRADGTFTIYLSRKGEDSGSGRWRLTSHPYFGEQGIEFDGGRGSDSYADEYRITRRYGQLCIEFRPNEEYWCKS